MIAKEISNIHITNVQNLGSKIGFVLWFQKWSDLISKQEEMFRDKLEHH